MASMKDAPESSREAERITKEFQALALKYNWDAGVCYVIPGEMNEKTGALRVLGTCGGLDGMLEDLGNYVSAKIKAKVILARASEVEPEDRFN